MASTPAEVSRRTVLGASAFAVPAIVAVTATPAFAVSGVVETVSVVLGQNTVAPGGSTSVTVTLKDSTGATVAGRLVSLSSSSTSVTLANTTGTSDASGVMTTTATVASGATTGTAVITATSDGKNGSASLTYQTPGTVTATSTYSGVPYGTALSADGSLLYIAGTTTTVVSNMFGGTTTVSKKAVSVVNASTLAVVRTIAFDSFGNAPTIVRLFSDGSKAWVTSPSDYGEIDIATSTMTDHGTPPVAAMYDTFLAVDDSGLYALGGTSASMMGVMRYSFATGNKTMAHKANLGSLERIARSVDGTRIYFARSAVSVFQGLLGYIDIASRDAYTVLSGGTTSAKAAMAMAPDGATLYLAGLTSNAKDIAAFDLATNKIAWKVTPTSTAPVDMQVSADGSFLYMVDPSGNLRVLDIASRTVSTVVSAPFAGTASYPCLTLSPNGKNAYVSLQATSNTATTSRVFAVAL